MQRLISLMAVCGASCLAIAEDALPFDVEASLTYQSKSVFRGLNVIDGSVLVPEVQVGFGGLRAGYWGSYVFSSVATVYETRDQPNGDFNEQRLFVEYGLSEPIPLVDLTVGYIAYFYPGGSNYAAPWNDTSELYVRADFDLPFSPSLTVFQDIDEYDGTYFEAGASLSLPDSLVWGGVGYPIDLTARLGYGTGDHNAFYFARDSGAFTELGLSASVDIPAGDNFAITPGLHFSTVLDGSLDTSPRPWNSSPRQNLWFTLGFGLSF